jgi:hypothetical protein
VDGGEIQPENVFRYYLTIMMNLSGDISGDRNGAQKTTERLCEFRPWAFAYNRCLAIIAN